MDFTSRLDAITVDSLRERGSSKWLTYPDSYGAWIAEMDFGVAEPVARALHEVVDRARFGYNPPGIVDDLGRAYTQFAQRRYGVSLDPAMVRPLPDVLAGMGAIIENFTRPGTPVIVPTPAYMPFLLLPDWWDRPILQVPMARDGDRWVYDLDALAAAFDAGAQLLTLCNPHNPIGRVLTRDEMLAIADVVEAKGGLVFSDEIHAPLIYQGRTHVPYATLDERTAAHTITATSASKAFNLPGLKCAQIVFSNPEHRQAWVRAGRWVEQGASLPGIVANITAYDEGEPWLTNILAYLDRNRTALSDLVAEKLPGVRYQQPEGTYLALLDFRERGLGDDPAAIFREHAQVALTPGPACGDAAKGFARLNYGTPLPILTQIIERISGVLAERG
ncbi:cystathionine beta-lyase [Kineosphaera limosa]|uniref:cysteine-S-conjugate beta-lyase n=1 Tax=Kineosphaera limosa NBRC 100340 TaxID=1184609 RepID=K6W6U2_9MICO|nr:aminotransferase class I/II-fold pyridoxal phosphate-dependent enzyme [Kineosphaera limosa]NYE00894.1 cystathionine beta-lyase [Kineosphaera limosa]GAB94910.1 cystathionine beta-lyase [Kineosphaera limosa NBRC 100340]